MIVPELCPDDGLHEQLPEHETSATEEIVITDSAIAPTVLSLPSSITAATVTDAEGCGVDGLFRPNVTSQAVPAATPPDAANSTS